MWQWGATCRNEPSRTRPNPAGSVRSRGQCLGMVARLHRKFVFGLPHPLHRRGVMEKSQPRDHHFFVPSRFARHTKRRHRLSLRMAQTLKRRHHGLLRAQQKAGYDLAKNSVKGRLRSRKESVALVGYSLNARWDGDIVSWWGVGCVDLPLCFWGGWLC